MAVLLTACGGPGTEEADKDVVVDIPADRGVDTTVEEVAPELIFADRSVVDVVDLWVLEVTEVELSVELPDLGPEEGGFGWPCEENGECDSGFCIETADGPQCTVACMDECPKDWFCVQNQSALPDLLYLCVPGHTRLCIPCSAHLECNPAGIDLGDKCVDHGEAGAFCGAVCKNDDHCPEDYTCEVVTYFGGGQGKQCSRTDSVCECSNLAMERGAWTNCYKENEFGTCDGLVQCLEEGPALCDAPVPIEEECDGEDNDCNGEIDEELGETTCGLGVCEHTVSNCVGGIPLACDEWEGVGAEICNGLDDNCDGETDEGFDDTDGDGMADCLDDDDDNDGIPDSADNCVGVKNEDQANNDLDSQGDACDTDDDNDQSPDDEDCAPKDDDAYPGADELCDTKDNNCDGQVDEGFGSVTCGLGECEHTVEVCVDAQVFTCDPLEGAAAEVCDEKDNDCDGDVDEEGTEGCQLYYLDLDQDLYGAETQGKCLCEPYELYIAPEFGDCKPLDPDIHPGAEEICDGVDNNCDGLTDDLFQDLDFDGDADCVDDDDDDDKVLDLIDNCPITSNPDQENFDQDQYGDACDWDDDNDEVGDGLDCEPFNPLVNPDMEEVCNGFDDDCDSAVDEDFGLTACGKGVCTHAVENCFGGVLQVCDEWEGASEEICDGLDNDCDGWVDEELGETTCGLGVCEHTVSNCVGGLPQVCDEWEGVDAEECDGLDNDCDGEVDEELGETTCGLGICLHTSANCVGGIPQTCDDKEGSAPEECDGLDNDCDGALDEGLGTVTCGLGECEHTVMHCIGGVPQNCDPMAGAEPEECDGKDNNCNGDIDEDLGTTTCGLGICEHSIESCVAGVPQICDPKEGADLEKCDGLDNDCDGEVDEEGPGQGEPCSVPGASGECANGIIACGDLGLYCAQTIFPEEEECDGLDEDCTGVVDDLAQLGEECDSGLDGLCAEGTWMCEAAGKGLYCEPTIKPGEIPEICNNGIDEDCTGQDCLVAGDNKWNRYLKTGVNENYDTFMPTPADFGVYQDKVDDSTTFTGVPAHSVYGYRTWVYVSGAKAIPICSSGDDGVALYQDGQFVCGRANAEDPPNCGAIALTPGWTMLEGLVYNGPGPGSLVYDIVISGQVDVMSSEEP